MESGQGVRKRRRVISLIHTVRWSYFELSVTMERTKFAKNIAKHIVMEREKAPIETTGQLCEIIRHAIPNEISEEHGTSGKENISGDSY